MDSQTHITQMLELMDRPAFCVLDSLIIYANSAARAHLVPVGKPVLPLICVGAEEYAAFTQGYLYLGVTIENTSYESSVTIIDQYHIFTLNSDSSGQLQALALAAKEFREPLNRIMAISEHLPQTMQQDHPTTDMIAKMNRGLYQILRMVNNMSDAGGQTAPRLELRDVGSVMQELFEQAAEYCACVDITLTFDNLHTSIFSLIDTQRLERCIYNILSNSLKYTEPGGHIHAVLVRRKNTLYLTISDTGCGLKNSGTLPPFERFLREPRIEDIRHGLGLGLTLVRNTAAVHGGTVLIDQSADCGARITISLPIRQNYTKLHSPAINIDYAGERNHALVELADSLPYSLYLPEKE